ncbi:MAG: DUF5995 family protein [Chitinophagaceae bacterium]
MQANTLEEVIARLDAIINSFIQQSSRLGYFSCLYRKMTIAIKEAMGKGEFEDEKRMERLDVTFANRYLDAYSQYSSGQKSTTSWQTAFDAAETDQYTVLQHLLFGINAHINLDLGIAAAKISTPETIGLLAADFNKVNLVIGSLFADVQASLSKIAFPMYFIKKINPEKTNAILNFSLVKARQTAWANALLLSEIGESGEAQVITETDKIVTRVALGIQSPGKFTGILLGWIRWTESKDIRKNIDCLL